MNKLLECVLFNWKIDLFTLIVWLFIYFSLDLSVEQQISQIDFDGKSRVLRTWRKEAGITLDPWKKKFYYAIAAEKAKFGPLLHHLLRKKALWEKREVPVFYNLSDPQVKLSTSAGSCQSCAVVTNSGYLLGSAAGSAIDSHDCVFRINNGPTEGYEDDVGSKTTFRLVAHNVPVESIIEICAREKSNVSVIFWFPQGGDETRVNDGYKLLEKTPPNVHVFMGVQNNQEYFDRIWEELVGVDRQTTSVWITSGFATVITALQLCDAITIYGILSRNFCRSRVYRVHQIPYSYYYKQQSLSACGFMNLHEKKQNFSHKFILEHDIFKFWSFFRDIRFRAPKYM